MSEALHILYRDDCLVAIDKPAGLLVHRSMLDRHETRFAVQLLRDQIGARVYPVHRLDRGTSGILLFALDPDTCTRAATQFEHQQVVKTYLAIVRGHPPEAGSIDHPLSRRVDAYANRPEEASHAAQAARTHYRRLATAELPEPVDRYPTSRYALLEIHPETGRQHQIRRHLKHIAHPIIGDATYGKGIHNRFFRDRFGCARLLLTCTDLRLTHPASGQALHLHAPPPPDFTAVFTPLGWQGVEASRSAANGSAA